jgi:MFS family permease
VASATVNSTSHRDGWRVVWVAFVVAVFGWGIGFYGPAVYLPTLHQTRGWSISTISSAITAHYLLSAALIAWLPEAYRRFGVGRVTFVGAILAGFGAVAWANVQQPWQLVPALTVSGAGWAATSGAALNAIVTPWFDRDRPKAMSMAFNGASVGGVLFAPLWTGLISAFGLTWAALILGVAMPAVLCPLAWFFLRHAPSSISPTEQAARPTPRGQLLRQPRFITISLAFALGLFAQIGLFAHLIARLAPDFGGGVAAMAISVITLCAVFGRSLLGWLLGEHDRRLAGAASLVMQAIGSLFLAFGSGSVPLTAGCILFGSAISPRCRP